ncbi:mitochondrial transcription rescue factor 1 [Drosophila sulfurigaster albostrigata]|uniref:mitochondrial transcription rescue factor 1 n=1 Tax=Drosophila sulfurigaster albostrigata TaxID=89887 RepID=UPI002D21CA3C|nr:mitochondrial transcription rescue factor 1 [Drosophila sulfurigaster albostrigata]
MYIVYLVFVIIILEAAQQNMLSRSLRLLSIRRIVATSTSYNSLNKAAATCGSVSAKLLHTTQVAWKYDKKSSRQSNDVDSDDEADEEFKDDRDSKVVKTKVNSLRADLLLKSGLGMARNKVEHNFYESKIRVNGKKLQKKSVQLDVGDEIDVIRGFSQTNPSHLVIARVVILSAAEREEGLSVHLRRYKSLLIENYKTPNAFKSSETVIH